MGKESTTPRKNGDRLLTASVVVMVDEPTAVIHTLDGSWREFYGI